jgi:hypothetical protein
MSLEFQKKKQIPNRIRGKSVDLLKEYLGHQWFTSVYDTQPPELFMKIFDILKALSFDEVNAKILAMRK